MGLFAVQQKLTEYSKSTIKKNKNLTQKGKKKYKVIAMVTQKPWA